MPQVIRVPKYPSANILYVGRPTFFGNSWIMGERSPINGKSMSRQEVVEHYLHQDMEIYQNPDTLRVNTEAVQGLDLACWCHIWDGQGDNPMYCHADLLLGLFNPEVDSPWHRLYKKVR